MRRLDVMVTLHLLQLTNNFSSKSKQNSSYSLGYGCCTSRLNMQFDRSVSPLFLSSRMQIHHSILPVEKSTVPSDSLVMGVP